MSGPYREPGLPPAPRRVSMPTVTKAALASSVALWLASLWLPAVYLRAVVDGRAIVPMYGLECLILGPLAAFGGCVAAFANLTGCAALLMLGLRQYGATVTFAVISLLLASSTLVLAVVGSPIDAQGTNYKMTSIGPGLVLWLSSLIIPGAAALWRMTRGRHTAGGTTDTA